MATSRLSATLLRGGVSLAALAAAWGLPGAAQAQSCTLGNNLQGLPANTIVACPSSTQLQFPGAVPEGPGGIPNGSVLLGVIDGSDPAHQLWTYQDPGGNNQNIFLSGIYNLRNGIGGATELQGPNILDLSGAGLCGAGGLSCPFPQGIDATQQNLSSPTGGGTGNGFVNVIPIDPFVDQPNSFGSVEVADLNATTCEAMPSGASCTSGFRFGPIIDGGGNLQQVGAGTIDVTVTGAGFQDFYLDTSLLPEDVAANLAACDASGEASCAVLIDSKGTPFFYGPSVSGGADSGTNILPLSIVTDPAGTTVVDISSLLQGFGEGINIDAVLDAHGSNRELLLNFNNNATVPGGGVQATFSQPGYIDRFLLTQDVGSSEPAAANSYVLSYPIAPAGNYESFNFGPQIGSVYVDLSSLPQVTSVTPGTQPSADNARRSFILTFSAPMDGEAVQDNFIVRSFSGQGQTVVGAPGPETSEFRYGPEFNTEVDFSIEFSGDGLQAEFWVEPGARLDDERDDFADQRFSISLDQAPGTKIGFQTPDPDPGSATSTGFAVALIFGVFAEPDNGAQAAQMTDAVTAGIPTTDGKRDAVDTTQLMFQPAALNVASSEPEIIGKANERDSAGFLHERYVVRYPDGSLVAIDAAGQRIGPVTSLLGTYQVHREGTPLLAGMGAVVQESANTFRIERPSNFIILPSDQPAPSAGSSLPSATRDDLKAGSIVYDLQTKQPVGRILDDQGHVQLNNPDVYSLNPTPRLPFPIPEDVKVYIPPPS